MKRFSVFVLISVLALSVSVTVSSCDKKGKDGDASASELAVKEKGAEGVLTYMFWGAPNEKKAVIKVLQEFQKKHDIGLKLVHADSLSFPDKLQAMYAGGTPPDVFYLHVAEFYRYASKGLLYSLDDFADDKDFGLDDFYPSLIKAFTFGDSLYGIPKDWTSFVLYYNKDLFDEAGIAYPSASWTWDDFLDAAKKLTKDIDGDGKLDQYGMMVETWADWYYSWIKQNGGEIFDNEGNWVFAKGEYLSANAEAIQFVADLINKHKVAPDVATSKQMGNYESFMGGRAAMCIYGRWAELKFKDIKKFKWNYAVLPKKKKHASTVVTVALSVSSETENPDAAWKLVKFMTSYEGQVFTAEAGLAVPSRISLVESKSYLEAPQVIKNQPHLKMSSASEDPFIQSLKFSVWSPANANWIEVRTKLDQQIEDVFLGNKDAKSVILGLDTVVNDIIAGSGAVEEEGDEE